MKNPFDAQSVPSTTMVMAQVGPMTRAGKELRQSEILSRLQLWDLPQSSGPKTYLDNAPISHAETFQQLFLSLPDLDADLMKNILPMMGSFAGGEFLPNAYVGASKRISELVRKKNINVLAEKVDEMSGRHSLVVERNVQAQVAGVWCLAGISAEFRDLNKVTKLPGSRHMDLIEVFSWLLTYTDHPDFSHTVEDPKTHEERKEPLCGIFLPGVETEIPMESRGKKQVLKYPCYLVRAKTRDPKTSRFGWVLTPLIARRLWSDAPLPLVTLCTPEDGF